MKKLIGSADRIENYLYTLIDKRTDQERNFYGIVYGDPGIGKTELCKNLIERIGQKTYTYITRMSGKNVNLECVNCWLNQFNQPDFLPGYTIILIDEIDLITNPAQELILSLLDRIRDNKNKVIILGTSNAGREHFEKRFQSRFTVEYCMPPAVDEIEQFLIDQGTPADIAADIAENCDSDIRAAESDAENIRDTMAAA